MASLICGDFDHLVSDEEEEVVVTKGGIEGDKDDVDSDDDEIIDVGMEPRAPPELRCYDCARSFNVST